MKITVTPSILCSLFNGYFTLEACEAIYKYCEENSGPDFAATIGDIGISFTEVPASWAEEGDDIIAELNNGNIVIAL